MKRIESIDVLRGYDMLWITGGAGVVTALAKALPSPVTDFLDQDHAGHRIVDVRGWTKWAWSFPTFGLGDS